MSESIKPIPQDLQAWWESGCEDKDNFDLLVISALEAARQESAVEIADLRRQLAAVKAREAERTKFLQALYCGDVNLSSLREKLANLVRPIDNSALDTLLADKGRETIEKCAKVCANVRDAWADYSDGRSASEDCLGKIRALMTKEKPDATS